MRRLTGDEVPITLERLDVRVGDRYLLCTDGLTDPVNRFAIHEALKITDVTKSADRLIELALRGGGPDNITVVVSDVVLYDYESGKPPLKRLCPWYGSPAAFAALQTHAAKAELP
jgi:PPM family protein phosphatase